jgi:hypothetical protein
MSSGIDINVVAEGDLDRIVAERLVTEFGGTVGLSRAVRGKSQLDPLIPKYAKAAEHGRWLVMRDLDRDAPCPSALRDRLVSARPDTFVLRFPVPMIESWMLADYGAIAGFLGVPATKISKTPEALTDPKRAIIDCVRTHSRRPYLRDAIVPRPRSGLSEGPEYTALMIEFTGRNWNPARASESGRAPSLTRALSAVKRLVEAGRM